LLLSSSAAIGIGAGLAMMPIYNHEVQELKTYDIDIHDYEIAFVISTINTLLLTSTCSITGLGSNGTANRLKVFLLFLMALIHHVLIKVFLLKNLSQSLNRDNR
jgi:hypothetical protein